MGKQKLKGKDLRRSGWSNQQKSLAITIMARHFKHLRKPEILEILFDLAASPEKYKDHEQLGQLAETFMEVVEKENFTSWKLKEEVTEYKVYGKKFIDQNTLKQMDAAMRLPVAEKGALMPDAHVGYGLPVGGVIATRNEVIPYAVGLDIGCRMALTIFDASAEFIDRYRYQLKQALQAYTFFGTGTIQGGVADHEVLDRGEFRETEILRQLHGKACKQLGTSGSGNHFVEFGQVAIDEGNQWNIPKGNYLGLLTHSGSRGLGATIAKAYTKIAMDVCRLPKGIQHLAWLDLNTEAGMEYWQAMNLAGDYAKACHDVIHHKLSKALGVKSLVTVENHHNFAWKETHDGKEVVVHRKGATPAGEGVLGVIPGSMASPAYVVRGKGNAESLCSASHGAGRVMSRSQASKQLKWKDAKRLLQDRGVHLISAGIDEVPFVYKDIDTVMGAQSELVEAVARFFPRLVKMAPAGERPED